MQGEESILQDLYFTTKLEDKNTRKLMDKMAKAKARRIFLLKCKHNKLCPTFLKLKTDHIVHNCRYLTEKYERLKNNFIYRTINLLIADTTKTINRLAGEIMKILNEFENLKGRNLRETLEHNLNQAIKYKTNHHKSIHDKKIEKLINSQKENKEVNEDSTRIVNLTQITLPEFVTKTLNLGPKYAMEVDRELENMKFQRSI